MLIDTIESKHGVGEHVRASDPEPLAIVALCVATLSMAGSLAGIFINYRKYASDKQVRQDDATADFQAESDLFRAVGTRLLNLVSQLDDQGAKAFHMTELLPIVEQMEGRSPVRTLRAGETSLDLTPNQRQEWNTLLNSSARMVAEMNSAVEAYEERFAKFLTAARRLDQISALGLGPFIGNVVDQAIAFRKALDSYQNLRASSTVEDARKRFDRLSQATYAMIEAGIGFAHLTTIILNQNR